MPGAQVFAQCAVGDGPNSEVQFKSKVSHEKKGAKSDRLVRYEASIKNTDKTVGLQGLAVTVELPTAGVTYVGSKASIGYGVSASAGKKTYYKRKARVIVNGTSTPVTVTWTDLVLPPRKGMRFTVEARINTLVSPV